MPLLVDFQLQVKRKLKTIPKRGVAERRLPHAPDKVRVINGRLVQKHTGIETDLLLRINN